MHVGKTFVRLGVAASRTLGVYAPWTLKGIEKVCESIRSCLIPSGYCLRMADRTPGHEESMISSSQFMLSFVKLGIAGSRTLGVYAPWTPQGILKVCEIVRSCLIPSGCCLRMADRTPGHEDSMILSSRLTLSLHVLYFRSSSYACWKHIREVMDCRL